MHNRSGLTIQNPCKKKPKWRFISKYYLLQPVKMCNLQIIVHKYLDYCAVNVTQKIKGIEVACPGGRWTRLPWPSCDYLGPGRRRGVQRPRHQVCAAVEVVAGVSFPCEQKRICNLKWWRRCLLLDISWIRKSTAAILSSINRKAYIL